MHACMHGLRIQLADTSSFPSCPACSNIKVHDRKIRKAKAKMNSALAERLKTMKPGYKVDHLVKER